MELYLHFGSQIGVLIFHASAGHCAKIIPLTCFCWLQSAISETSFSLYFFNAMKLIFSVCAGERCTFLWVLASPQVQVPGAFSKFWNSVTHCHTSAHWPFVFMNSFDFKNAKLGLGVVLLCYNAIMYTCSFKQNVEGVQAWWKSIGSAHADMPWKTGQKRKRKNPTSGQTP